MAQVIFTESYTLIQKMPGNGPGVGHVYHIGDIVTDDSIISALVSAGAPILFTDNVPPVLLPVTDGDFAVFNGTEGQISDRGYLPSNSAKTKVVMANASVTIGHVAKFSDISGTIQDGGLAASVSGSTASGNIAIFNDSIGTIKDLGIHPSDPTSPIVASVENGTTAGNIAIFQDAFGSIIEKGLNIIANTTAAYAGGGTSNVFSTTGLLSSNIVSASIKTQSNNASIVKVVPTTNALTVTFSADPGANTTVSYIAISIPFPP